MENDYPVRGSILVERKMKINYPVRGLILVEMKRIVFILFFLGWVASAMAQAPHLFEHTYPSVVEEDLRIRSLINQVSIDSLTATIEHLQSYHTRQWNSQMVYQVQDWLIDFYQARGLDSVVLHDFPVIYHDTLYETSDNVIAIKKGTLYPDEYVVCGAHYDSYNKNPGQPDLLQAPGADDNASGVAGILETARLLSTCSFERSVVFCNFAAEEIGLVGSEAYAKDCAEERMDIVGYFNLDMIGYLEEGSDIKVNLLYTGQDSLFADYVFDLSHVYFPEMPIYQSWLQWGDSDYSSFNRSGYPAVHTFEDTYHCSPFIHTTDDILGVSVNSMDQVKRFTELNVGLVATLAGLISSSVEDVDAERLVVYPNPAQGFVTVKGPVMRQVEIYNLFGQQVLKETCHDEEVCLNVSSLAAGVYVLRVVDDAMHVHSHRLVTY